MSVLRAENAARRWISKKRGCVDRAQQRDHGRVEALGVPHHQHAVVFFGHANERVGLVERGGQRFLDQHVDAAGEQRTGDLEVVLRRHRDAGRPDLAEQLPDVAEGPQPYSRAMAAARSASRSTTPTSRVPGMEA